MATDEINHINQADLIYKEMVDNRSPEFFCDYCGHYPIEPVHGHFMCPECRQVTKCCEGLPQDV